MSLIPQRGPLHNPLNLDIPSHLLLPQLLSELSKSEIGKGYIRVALEALSGRRVPFTRKINYIAEYACVHFSLEAPTIEGLEANAFIVDEAFFIDKELEPPLLKAGVFEPINDFAQDNSGDAFALLATPGTSVTNGHYILARTPLNVYILYTQTGTKMCSFYTPEQWEETIREYEEGTNADLNIDTSHGWYLY